MFKKRKELSLNQKEFAKKIGTTQRIVSEIENGQYNMSCGILNRIFKEMELQLISEGKDLISGKKYITYQVLSDYSISYKSWAVPGNSIRSESKTETSEVKKTFNLDYCYN